MNINAMNQDDLIRLWDRVFLNYTPDAPDHWTDPTAQEKNVFFEDPLIAVPILLKIGDRNRQQAYVEYFAAIWRQNFSRKPESLHAALPLLQYAANQWNDRTTDLMQLISAIQNTLRNT